MIKEMYPTIRIKLPEGGRTMEKVKIIVFSLFVFLGVLLFSGAEALDQRFPSSTGFKYIKNYTPREYNAPPQNWMILQDRRGIIYAANQGGVLEFDGSTWRTIGVVYGSARAMDIDDSSGTIYIGGRNELGYLGPDDKGTLDYVSLLDYLDMENRGFSDVYPVLCGPGGVWFRTDYRLLWWHTGEFFVEGAGKTTPFGTVFPWNDNVYVQQKSVGLIQLKDDSFLPIPGSEAFAERKIYLAVTYDNRRLLIGTRGSGFFLYDGAAAVPFPTEVDDYVAEHQLSHGIRLSTGNFALATLKGGVVVMDAQGRLKEMFNNAFGLKSNNVKYIFQDSGGNLWLALNNGISRIDYSSPVSYFDDRSGLNGLVLSVVRHKGRLFVGTDSGLYYLESSSPASLPEFRPVKDIIFNCFDLLSMGDSLLVAANKGVFLVEGTDKVREVVPKTEARVLTVCKRVPGRVWVGTANGVSALRQENGLWRLEGQCQHIQQRILSIVEDDKGNLWLGTLTQGVFKTNFPGNAKDFQRPRVFQYGTANGLPEGEVYVTRAAGHVVAATPIGIFRFDETEKSFVPDLTLGKTFAGGSQSVFRLVEDPDKNIWFHSNLENFCAVPTQNNNGTYKVKSIPFPGFPLSQVNALYPDQQKQFVWFAANDGLICFDTKREKDYHQSFFALMRKVTKKGGEVIYNGFKIPGTLQAFLPVLQYKERNLHFESAAPFYDDETKTSYRYYMEGYDDGWSDWTQDTVKDYTNLDAGRYTLRVQAKNVYGTLSSEDTFSFRVLPPWYLTWWAFMLYAASAVLLVYLVVKWRSWRLVLEKQRLEQVIEKRTLQINQANARLKDQNLQLEEQSEKLKEMDKLKSRFFANISHEFRTPLTLITGPLDKIRSDCRDKGLKEQINVVNRNARRLLKLINQLLDLSKFESGKMKLQANQIDLVPFLRSILEPFEVAVSQYRVNLVFHTDRESIPLYVDPEKLEKIMANLLSNAVKFTPPGGSITVSAAVIPGTPGETETPAASEGHVTLSVKDTGVGIPHDQLPHIFDRFYQADTVVEHYHEGSGIGLALVKELVELHHGEIMVRSKEKGEDSGTEFILRFPLGKEHLKREEMVENHTRHKSLEEKEIPEASLLELEAIEASEHEEDMETEEEKVGEVPDKDIVLVVEDNADLRYYIRTSLEPDYTVAEAKDGREGIEKARSIIPDLIISDIMMPEKDGYELCRDIKSDISTSHIPVILLTARSSEEDMVRGLETGADDYITKPFNPRLLRARIKNLIDLRRQLQVSINRDMLLQPSRMSLSRIDHEFLNDLKDVIEKNLSDPDFNVEDLSKRLYMSRATVYRKVLALSGETPTDFIRTCRLRRAAQLLKSQYGSVTEVAFEVGFTSRAYFTKCFKEKFHKLPSEYFSTESS
jgi:signal transduction histidine kinase/DNA-binding response OmpR family regulator/ligand-binding sensor domain-containing protein